MLDKAIKEAHSADVAIHNSHNLRRTITDKPQKYTALQEDLVRIGQVETVRITQPVLPTTGNIPNK